MKLLAKGRQLVSHTEGLDPSSQCRLGASSVRYSQAAQPLGLTFGSKGLNPGPINLIDHPPFIKLCLGLLPSGGPTHKLPRSRSSLAQEKRKGPVIWAHLTLQAEAGRGRTGGTVKGQPSEGQPSCRALTGPAVTCKVGMGTE